MVKEPGAPWAVLAVFADFVKVAFTVLAADMLTVVEVDVPVAPPDHPVKEDPDAGAAVSVMLVPEVILALHAVPQEMPPELLVTVPVPVPAFVMVNAYIVVALTLALPMPAARIRANSFAFMIHPLGLWNTIESSFHPITGEDVSPLQFCNGGGAIFELWLFPDPIINEHEPIDQGYLPERYINCRREYRRMYFVFQDRACSWLSCN